MISLLYDKRFCFVRVQLFVGTIFNSLHTACLHVFLLSVDFKFN